jgi:hypothetical protein
MTISGSEVGNQGAASCSCNNATEINSRNRFKQS